MSAPPHAALRVAHPGPGAADGPASSGWVARLAPWWRIAAAGCAIVSLTLAGDRLVDQFGFQARADSCDGTDLMVVAALVGYVLAMALPFVPGIEIGLALMLVLGDAGIVLVYLSTQFALALSFLLGRLVPAPTIAAALRWLGVARAARLAAEIEATPPAGRVALLAGRAPAGRLTLLARHRYLALALLLNLPGNALIGGAGGIGMIAGMSRAFPFLRFALLIAAATIPVPLFVLLTRSC